MHQLIECAQTLHNFFYIYMSLYLNTLPLVLMLMENGNLIIYHNINKPIGLINVFLSHVKNV